jgi:hypothetical protein
MHTGRHLGIKIEWHFWVSEDCKKEKGARAAASPFANANLAPQDRCGKSKSVHQGKTRKQTHKAVVGSGIAGY